ncbi:MAG: hypothetical protein QF632_06775 [Candidatus Woesearchaeota archaeon]|jgi:uncharacterized membrane protein|nr:hypothetical protein [Candidatus Woesearchaeota archaeon]|tara:strand:- start:426 stop:812 length:387 start_codon:yes stop_codon:yes gene_type:complete
MKKRQKRGDRYLYFLLYSMFIFVILIGNLNPLRSIQFEDATPGQDLEVRVSIVNELGRDLENVRLRAMGLDIDTFDARGTIDIDGKDSTTKYIYLPIPKYTAPGDYYVKFTLSHKDFRRVKYREIRVV